MTKRSCYNKWCSDDAILRNKASNFFSLLFQDEGATRSRLHLEGLPCLDNREVEKIMEVTAEEVWDAVKSMKSFKDLGQMAFNHSFLKIIGILLEILLLML